MDNPSEQGQPNLALADHSGPACFADGFVAVPTVDEQHVYLKFYQVDPTLAILAAGKAGNQAQDGPQEVDGAVITLASVVIKTSSLKRDLMDLLDDICTSEELASLGGRDGS